MPAFKRRRRNWETRHEYNTQYAQYTDNVVKIGVLSDMSSLYADNSGAGSIAAAKLAVGDFGAAAKGIKVEIDSADHQNKADIGSSIAKFWYDVDKIDMSEVTRLKNKVFLNSGVAASGLDAAIDKCLKRMLFVRGLKSISASSSSAPRRRVAGPSEAA